MTATFSPLGSVTVGSGGTSTIDFSNIPNSYADLCIFLSLRSSDTGFIDPNIKFNNSNSNKFIYYHRGSGSSTGGGDYPYTVGTIPGSNKTANTFSSISIYIPNYASSVTKSFNMDSVTEDNASLSYQTILGGYWSDNTPINQITFTQNFVEYSTVALYGIKKS